MLSGARCGVERSDGKEDGTHKDRQTERTCQERQPPELTATWEWPSPCVWKREAWEARRVRALWEGPLAQERASVQGSTEPVWTEALENTKQHVHDCSGGRWSEDRLQPARPEVLQSEERNTPKGDNIKTGERGRWKQKPSTFTQYEPHARE